MSILSNQLIEIIEKESAIYQEVLELAREKKQIIIDGKIQELEVITKREQVLVGSLIKLENLRSSTVEEIVGELGIRSIDNVTELVGYLDETTQRHLLNLKSKLSETVDLLSDENSLNNKLIEQSLDMIEFNMNLITGFNSEGTSYGSDADEKDVKRKTNLFDARV